MTDDHSRTSGEGLHEFSVVRKVGRRANPDVLLLATLLLLFKTWGADVGNNIKPDYIKSTFCVENHLLPSIFVIGIQKCGTTTLTGILEQFKGIWRGKKEHHFFDQAKTYTNYKYYKQFPNCKDAHRTYDNTPNYTNPYSSSADNIKAFYEKLGIPLEGVSFIAMVCRPVERLRSAYYHNLLYHRFRWINNMTSNFNEWFKYILTHQEEEGDAILKRGFYDEIFEEYYHTFPQSTFLIIDSSAAFEDEQALADTLAVFLKLGNTTIHAVHRNKNHEKTDEWNEYNSVIAELFYRHHEKRFVEDLKQQKNVETFPKAGFDRL